MRFGWSAGSSSALSPQTAGFGQLERNVRGCDPHLFALQDEIVARLANALQVQLVAAEARRAERAPTPDSMDLYFQGMSWIYKGASADTVAKAGALFQKALDLDPANIDALTGLAMVNFNVAAWGGTDDSAAYFATAEATASRALSLAPDNAFTHVILGLVLGFTKRAEQAIAHCECALAPSLRPIAVTPRELRPGAGDR
jgi:tetratricopeptide (TPR) repeat protein